MRRAAKQLGVELPRSRGERATGELLGALRVEIGKRLVLTPPAEHVRCTPCGEIATADTEFCPYCGDEGTPVQEGETEPAVEAESVYQDGLEVDESGDDDAEPGADTGAASDDDGDETGSEDESESDDDESEDDDDESEGDSDDVPAQPAPEPEKIEKPATGETVGIAGKGTTIAKNVPQAMRAQAKELEEVVEEIVTLKRNTVLLGYDIGLKCRIIRDRQLFKAKGYTSFKDFAAKELPFTRESALQLINIVEKHSRDDYEKIGYQKLRIIGAVSDEPLKGELLTAARKGATTKELTERAGTNVKKVAPAAVEKEKGEKITLLGKVGARAQVVKFHDSTTGEVVKMAGVFTAKSFNPNLYGEFEISDGVFIRIGLRTNSNMELESFSVRFVRASDSE